MFKVDDICVRVFMILLPAFVSNEISRLVLSFSVNYQQLIEILCQVFVNIRLNFS